MGFLDKAKGKLTEQSPVRHLVRYEYFGKTITEEFGSVAAANQGKKDIQKSIKEAKNVRVDITTKKK